MKKIMFGNSLILVGVALLVLVGFELVPVYAFWTAIAVIFVSAGLIMAYIGYSNGDH